MARRESDGVSEQLFQQGAVYFLQKAGFWVSRKEMQDDLNLGKSTACRLLEALSLRLPIQEKTGDWNVIFYRLPEDMKQTIKNQMVTIPTLTDDDRRLLMFLLHMAESSKLYGSMVDNLQKHLAEAELAHTNTIVPVYSANTVQQRYQEEAEDILPLLFQAVKEKRIVTLSYSAPMKKPKSYDIWPIGLFEQNGNLYLYSYNPKHQDTQTNACSRVQGVTLKEERFTLPEGTDIGKMRELADPFGITLKGKKTKVRILIEKEQAFYEKEKRWPEGTSITPKEDGSIILETKTGNIPACTMWILSLGPKAKVLSPKSLRLQIAEQAKGIIGRYES